MKRHHEKTQPFIKDPTAPDKDKDRDKDKDNDSEKDKDKDKDNDNDNDNDNDKEKLEQRIRGTNNAVKTSRVVSDICQWRPWGKKEEPRSKTTFPQKQGRMVM